MNNSFTFATDETVDFENPLTPLELASLTLSASFPEWDVAEKDGDVRMSRYLEFSSQDELREFEINFGSMMRTNNLFIMTQSVPGTNSVLVALRLRPSESAVIIAMEIARYVDEEEVAESAGTQKAA